MPSATRGTGRSRRRRRESTSSAASRRTSTTTWTRSSLRPSRRSGGSAMPAARLPDRTDMAELATPAVWAGVEPAFLTVGGRRRDQLADTGHAGRLSDLELLAELGVTAARYPVRGGRGGRETDGGGAGAGLGRRAELGIDPIVGLPHPGGGPVGVAPLDRHYPAR